MSKEPLLDDLALAVFDLNVHIGANAAIQDMMMKVLAAYDAAAATTLANVILQFADGMESQGASALAGQMPEGTEEQADRAIGIMAARFREFAAAASTPEPPGGGGLRVIVGGKSE